MVVGKKSVASFSVALMILSTLLVIVILLVVVFMLVLRKGTFDKVGSVH